MEVKFLEEYPSEETFQKAALLPGGTVFIASTSLSAFREHRSTLSKHAPAMRAAYWPILQNDARNGSYWVSVFSNPEELLLLKRELAEHEEHELHVLLDFELPLLRPWLFIKNLRHVRRNHRTIQDILNLGHAAHTHVYAIEWAVARRMLLPLLRFFGLSFCAEKHPHKPMIMHYSSMVSSNVSNLRWKRITERLRETTHLELALGTIGTGVFGNEPTLSPEDLHRDLVKASMLGVSAVTIFRLGGLTPGHISVLEQFVR